VNCYGHGPGNKEREQVGAAGGGQAAGGCGDSDRGLAGGEAEHGEERQGEDAELVGRLVAEQGDAHDGVCQAAGRGVVSEQQLLLANSLRVRVFKRYTEILKIYLY